MPLSTVNLAASLQWQLYVANSGGFQNTTQGPDGQNFSLTGINLSTFNQLYTASLSLSASASQTIDLTSMSNLVGESFGFGHVLTIMVLPTVQFTVSPGSSNPFTWFFGGASQSVSIPAGGCLVFSAASSATGTPVTGTSKTLTFTNSDSSTGSVDITILGSTT